jgi:oxaloacetate decarboxylase gamma subunit
MEFMMTILEMLQQSVILTILGMGVVFIFLWVMIVLVNFTGKVIYAMESKNGKSGNVLSGNDGKNLKPEITAAITAAVNKYTQKE